MGRQVQTKPAIKKKTRHNARPILEGCNLLLHDSSPSTFKAPHRSTAYKDPPSKQSSDSSLSDALGRMHLSETGPLLDTIPEVCTEGKSIGASDATERQTKQAQGGERDAQQRSSSSPQQLLLMQCDTPCRSVERQVPQFPYQQQRHDPQEAHRLQQRTWRCYPLEPSTAANQAIPLCMTSNQSCLRAAHGTAAGHIVTSSLDKNTTQSALSPRDQQTTFRGPAASVPHAREEHSREPEAGGLHVREAAPPTAERLLAEPLRESHHLTCDGRQLKPVALPMTAAPVPLNRGASGTTQQVPLPDCTEYHQNEASKSEIPLPGIVEASTSEGVRGSRRASDGWKPHSAAPLALTGAGTGPHTSAVTSPLLQSVELIAPHHHSAALTSPSTGSVAAAGRRLFGSNTFTCKIMPSAGSVAPSFTERDSAAATCENLAAEQRPELACSPRNTLLLFDWDDTLFPSSALLGANIKLFDHRQFPPTVADLPLGLQRAIRACEDGVLRVLEAASRLGLVMVISNAHSYWLRFTLQQLMPRVYQQMCRLEIVVTSARCVCEAIGCFDALLWKTATFDAVLQSFLCGVERQQEQKALLDHSSGGYSRACHAPELTGRNHDGAILCQSHSSGFATPGFPVSAPVNIAGRLTQGEPASLPPKSSNSAVSILKRDGTAKNLRAETDKRHSDSHKLQMDDTKSFLQEESLLEHSEEESLILLQSAAPLETIAAGDPEETHPSAGHGNTVGAGYSASMKPKGRCGVCGLPSNFVNVTEPGKRGWKSFLPCAAETCRTVKNSCMVVHPEGCLIFAQTLYLRSETMSQRCGLWPQIENMRIVCYTEVQYRIEAACCLSCRDAAAQPSRQQQLLGGFTERDGGNIVFDDGSGNRSECPGRQRPETYRSRSRRAGGKPSRAYWRVRFNRGSSLNGSSSSTSSSSSIILENCERDLEEGLFGFCETVRSPGCQSLITGSRRRARSEGTLLRPSKALQDAAISSAMQAPLSSFEEQDKADEREFFNIIALGDQPHDRFAFFSAASSVMRRALFMLHDDKVLGLEGCNPVVDRSSGRGLCDMSSHENAHTSHQFSISPGRLHILAADQIAATTTETQGRPYTGVELVGSTPSPGSKHQLYHQNTSLAELSKRAGDFQVLVDLDDATVQQGVQHVQRLHEQLFPGKLEDRLSHRQPFPQQTAAVTERLLWHLRCGSPLLPHPPEVLLQRRLSRESDSSSCSSSDSAAEHEEQLRDQALMQQHDRTIGALPARHAVRNIPKRCCSRPKKQCGVPQRKSRLFATLARRHRMRSHSAPNMRKYTIKDPQAQKTFPPLHMQEAAEAKFDPNERLEQIPLQRIDRASGSGSVYFKNVQLLASPTAEELAQQLDAIEKQLHCLAVAPSFLDLQVRKEEQLMQTEGLDSQLLPTGSQQQSTSPFVFSRVEENESDPQGLASEYVKHETACAASTAAAGSDVAVAMASTTTKTAPSTAAAAQEPTAVAAKTPGRTSSALSGSTRAVAVVTIVATRPTSLAAAQASEAFDVTEPQTALLHSNTQGEALLQADKAEEEKLAQTRSYFTSWRALTKAKKRARHLQNAASPFSGDESESCTSESMNHSSGSSACGSLCSFEVVEESKTSSFSCDTEKAPCGTPREDALSACAHAYRMPVAHHPRGAACEDKNVQTAKPLTSQNPHAAASSEKHAVGSYRRALKPNRSEPESNSQERCRAPAGFQKHTDTSERKPTQRLASRTSSLSLVLDAILDVLTAKQDEHSGMMSSMRNRSNPFGKESAVLSSSSLSEDTDGGSSSSADWDAFVELLAAQQQSLRAFNCSRKKECNPEAARSVRPRNGFSREQGSRSSSALDYDAPSRLLTKKTRASQPFTRSSRCRRGVTVSEPARPPTNSKLERTSTDNSSAGRDLSIELLKRVQHRGDGIIRNRGKAAGIEASCARCADALRRTSSGLNCSSSSFEMPARFLSGVENESLHPKDSDTAKRTEPFSAKTMQSLPPALIESSSIDTLLVLDAIIEILTAKHEHSSRFGRAPSSEPAAVELLPSTGSGNSSGSLGLNVLIELLECIQYHKHMESGFKKLRSRCKGADMEPPQSAELPEHPDSSKSSLGLNELVDLLSMQQSGQQQGMRSAQSNAVSGLVKEPQSDLPRRLEQTECSGSSSPLDWVALVELLTDVRDRFPSSRLSRQPNGVLTGQTLSQQPSGGLLENATRSGSSLAYDVLCELLATRQKTQKRDKGAEPSHDGTGAKAATLDSRGLPEYPSKNISTLEWDALVELLAHYQCMEQETRDNRQCQESRRCAPRTPQSASAGAHTRDSSSSSLLGADELLQLFTNSGSSSEAWEPLAELLSAMRVRDCRSTGTSSAVQNTAGVPEHTRCSCSSSLGLFELLTAKQVTNRHSDYRRSSRSRSTGVLGRTRSSSSSLAWDAFVEILGAMRRDSDSSQTCSSPRSRSAGGLEHACSSSSSSLELDLLLQLLTAMQDTDRHSDSRRSSRPRSTGVLERTNSSSSSSCSLAWDAFVEILGAMRRDSDSSQTCSSPRSRSAGGLEHACSSSSSSLGLDLLLQLLTAMQDTDRHSDSRRSSRPRSTGVLERTNSSSSSCSLAWDAFVEILGAMRRDSDSSQTCSSPRSGSAGGLEHACSSSSSSLGLDLLLQLLTAMQDTDRHSDSRRSSRPRSTGVLERTNSSSRSCSLAWDAFVEILGAMRRDGDSSQKCSSPRSGSAGVMEHTCSSRSSSLGLDALIELLTAMQGTTRRSGDSRRSSTPRSAAVPERTNSSSSSSLAWDAFVEILGAMRRDSDSSQTCSSPRSRSAGGLEHACSSSSSSLGLDLLLQLLTAMQDTDRHSDSRRSSRPRSTGVLERTNSSSSSSCSLAWDAFVEILGAMRRDSDSSQTCSSPRSRSAGGLEHACSSSSSSLGLDLLLQLLTAMQDTDRHSDSRRSSRPRSTGVLERTNSSSSSCSLAWDAFVEILGAMRRDSDRSQTCSSPRSGSAGGLEHACSSSSSSLGLDLLLQLLTAMQDTDRHSDSRRSSRPRSTGVLERTNSSSRSCSLAWDAFVEILGAMRRDSDSSQKCSSPRSGSAGVMEHTCSSRSSSLGLDALIELLTAMQGTTRRSGDSRRSSTPRSAAVPERTNSSSSCSLAWDAFVEILGAMRRDSDSSQTCSSPRSGSAGGLEHACSSSSSSLGLDLLLQLLTAMQDTDRHSDSRRSSRPRSTGVLERTNSSSSSSLAWDAFVEILGAMRRDSDSSQTCSSPRSGSTGGLEHACSSSSSSLGLDLLLQLLTAMQDTDRHSDSRRSSRPRSTGVLERTNSSSSSCSFAWDAFVEILGAMRRDGDSSQKCSSPRSGSAGVMEQTCSSRSSSLGFDALIELLTAMQGTTQRSDSERSSRPRSTGVLERMYSSSSSSLGWDAFVELLRAKRRESDSSQKWSSSRPRSAGVMEDTCSSRSSSLGLDALIELLTAMQGTTRRSGVERSSRPRSAAVPERTNSSSSSLAWDAFVELLRAERVRNSSFGRTSSSPSGSTGILERTSSSCSSLGLDLLIELLTANQNTDRRSDSERSSRPRSAGVLERMKSSSSSSLGWDAFVELLRAKRRESDSSQKWSSSRPRSAGVMEDTCSSRSSSLGLDALIELLTAMQGTTRRSGVERSSRPRSAAVPERTNSSSSSLAWDAFVELLRAERGRNSSFGRTSSSPSGSTAILERTSSSCSSLGLDLLIELLTAKQNTDRRSDSERSSRPRSAGVLERMNSSSSSSLGWDAFVELLRAKRRESDSSQKWSSSRPRSAGVMEDTCSSRSGSLGLDALIELLTAMQGTTRRSGVERSSRPRSAAVPERTNSSSSSLAWDAFVELLRAERVRNSSFGRTSSSPSGSTGILERTSSSCSSLGLDLLIELLTAKQNTDRRSDSEQSSRPRSAGVLERMNSSSSSSSLGWDAFVELLRAKRRESDSSQKWSSSRPRSAGVMEDTCSSRSGSLGLDALIELLAAMQGTTRRSGVERSSRPRSAAVPERTNSSSSSLAWDAFVELLRAERVRKSSFGRTSSSPSGSTGILERTSSSCSSLGLDLLIELLTANQNTDRRSDSERSSRLRSAGVLERMNSSSSSSLAWDAFVELVGPERLRNDSFGRTSSSPAGSTGALQRASSSSGSLDWDTLFEILSAKGGVKGSAGRTSSLS